MERIRADIALVGGGGAAMSLLFQLCRSRADDALAGRSRTAPRLRVVVLDPRNRLAHRPHDRTWCYWERADPHADTATSRLWPAVEHAWRHLTVHGPDRRVDLDLDAAGLRYAMVRSADFYDLVREAVSDPAAGIEVQWLTEQADEVRDGDEVAQVITARRSVQVEWVFDSTPPRTASWARTSLLQHFRGVIVRTGQSRFDPDQAVLMDLRTAQPEHGLSFGYCLPMAADRALVEYTEFSRTGLDDGGYTASLGAYLDRVAGPSEERTVDHTETGAIPMTDARLETRTGHRVFRIGTAGGATRASTGYTFSAMHRQARGVAALLRTGQVPEPPRAYPARHRHIDAVLLRGLDRGHVVGTEFFPELFARNPIGRVLDFLDGATTRTDELALMRSVRALPMLRSMASLAVPSRHG